MVATGVGVEEAAAASPLSPAAVAADAAAVVVEVVAVADPVSIATTLPLPLPSHMGDPDCPCVDLHPCAPMLAQAWGEAAHSSIAAKAASVPRMLKNKGGEFEFVDCCSGEQLLVHIEWFGLRFVGYPAVVIREGSSPGVEYKSELLSLLGSCKASQPALASASRSSVVNAKSRFIAAVL